MPVPKQLTCPKTTDLAVTFELKVGVCSKIGVFTPMVQQAEY